MTPTTCRRTVLLLAALTLTACGGGGGDETTPPPPSGGGSFSVGGTVNGLASSGLVLQNNGGNDLAVTAAGAFTFTTQIASGSNYAVTVKTQPSGGPAQNCTVTNGSGTVGSAAVTNVTVTCATQTAKFLYVPNTSTNNVSAYSIDAATGALTEVASSPFPADQRPFNLSADPAGKFLFISNIGPPNLGSPTTPARLSAYSINATTGVLTPTPNSPFELSFPTPPNGTTFIGKLLIHPSGAFGYVSAGEVGGPGGPGLLYGATINSTSGDLTLLAGFPLNVGNGLSAGTFNAAGTVLYLPHNTFSGPAQGAVAAFTVNAPSGVLTTLATYPTNGVAPSIVVLNPSGSVLLTPNALSGSVATYRVDAAGTLTAAAGSPFSTGNGNLPSTLSVHPSKNFVYATNTNTPAGGTAFASSVAAFQLDATTGVLTPVANSPFLTGGMGASFERVEPSGKFLYVANRSSGTISAFSIDQTTGALTAVAGSPFATGNLPSAVTIDPSGKYLYVTQSGAATVSSFSINATTGVLTLVNSRATGGSPSFAALVGLQ